MENRPLRIEEQSMLLSAMLFAKDHIQEILDFFPDEQRARLLEAKEYFLNPANENHLSQIVIELRRLLLIDEYNIAWVHKSWIEQALKEEPSYLRVMIEKAIADHALYGHKDKLAILYGHFLKRLQVIPERLAIYDPVLMSLQAIRDEDQPSFFIGIGSYLAQHIDPLELKLSKDDPLDLGLRVCAIYLAGQKYRWQQRVILSLEIGLGQMLKQFIHEAKAENLFPQTQKPISDLLLKALDQLRA